MEWFTGFENLKKEPEIEFLGVVIDVRYPCDCRYCTKGKEALEERGHGRTNAQLHIVIAPLNNYYKLQHAFIDMTRRFQLSRRGVWEHAITTNKIPFKTKEEFTKFLKTHVILWKKKTIEDYAKEKMHYDEKEIERIKNSLGVRLNAQVLYPEKVIPKDALELYGLTVEEVKKRVEVFKEAWIKLMNGEDESKVYDWVVTKLSEDIEEEFEETEKIEEEIEEKEEKKTKKSKAKKKAKEEEEELEEDEEIIL